MPSPSEWTETCQVIALPAFEQEDGAHYRSYIDWDPIEGDVFRSAVHPPHTHPVEKLATGRIGLSYDDRDGTGNYCFYADSWRRYQNFLGTIDEERCQADAAAFYLENFEFDLWYSFEVDIAEGPPDIRNGLIIFSTELKTGPRIKTPVEVPVAMFGSKTRTAYAYAWQPPGTGGIESELVMDPYPSMSFRQDTSFRWSQGLHPVEYSIIGQFLPCIDAVPDAAEPPPEARNVNTAVPIAWDFRNYAFDLSFAFRARKIWIPQ